MNLLEQLPVPLIFAHRGASGDAPENTIASFQLAVALGASAVELDAKLTLDGEIIVFHDLTIDRTTNGKGELRKKTFAELRELDAGSFYGSQYAHERIPTLAEVFETIGSTTYINVELTNYASPSDHLPDRVAELVRKFNLQERVMFSSFFPFNLTRVKKLLPECPIGILTWEGMAGAISRGLFGELISPHIIHPNLGDVNESFMAHQNRLGRRVHVWTVNSPDEMQRLFNLGVSGIFTDHPRLALDLLEKR
jgi:glycerophosphoryl diester phosphodiesterase